MANEKLTSLIELSNPEDNDLIYIVDVSTGNTSKKAQLSSLSNVNDTNYLRLDTTNNPLTGNLEISSLNQVDGTHRLLLETYENTASGDNNELIRLQYLTNDAKAAIGFLDQTGQSKIWVQAHDYLTYYLTTTFTPADVNTVAEVITVTGNNYITALPVVLTTTGALPTGLSPSTTYYVRVVGSTLSFFASASDATNNINRIDLTTTGSGIGTITPDNTANGNRHRHFSVEVTDSGGTSKYTRLSIPYDQDITEMQINLSNLTLTNNGSNDNGRLYLQNDIFHTGQFQFFPSSSGSSRTYALGVALANTNEITLKALGSSELYMDDNLILKTTKVGLGTTAPSVPLELSYSDANTTITTGNATALRLTNTNTTTDNMSELAFTTNDTGGTNLRTSSIIGLNSSHTIGAMSGALVFNTRNAGTFSEKMRLISTGNVGIGVTVPTAVLHLKAGTATASTAPLKLSSGTNLTTGETGAIEYNGTNLFFTRTGTTRENVLVGNDGGSAPSTNSIGVLVDYYGTSSTRALTTPNSWASVVINGTTYKIPLYT